MTGGNARCARCRDELKDVDDGVRLCDQCCDQYEQACVDLIVLVPHLEAAVVGLDNVAIAVTHRAAIMEDDADHLRSVKSGRVIPAYLRSKHGRITLPATALPVNLDASELLDQVRRSLRGWATHLHGTAGATPAVGPVCAACRHTSCRTIRLERARWTDRVVALHLAQHVDQVRVDRQAGAIVADIVTARRKIEKAIDARVPELYCGPCDSPDVESWVDDDGTIHITTEQRICKTDMYADLGDTEVQCTTCGYVYPIEARRAWLLEAVRDVWARPAMIASAVTSMQIELTPARIDQWVSRDKKRHKRCLDPDACTCIVQVATDFDDDDGNPIMEPVLKDGKPVLDDDGQPVMRQAGKPLYRIGAVLDRLEQYRATEHARTVQANP